MSAWEIFIRRLEATNKALHAAQPYTYVGRDGKSVLARSLEARAEAAEARVKELEEYFSKCVSSETFLQQDARRLSQIETLEARVAELEARLAEAVKVMEPFARLAKRFEHMAGDDTVTIGLAADDLRAARAFMEGNG